MTAPISVDHTSLCVPEGTLNDVVSFLVKSLSHMNFREHMRPHPGIVGLGDQTAFFWVGSMPAADADQKTIRRICKFSHIAFKATDDAQVDQFYKAALEAGGIDNGKPGIREMYHPKYYAAFIIDPVVGVQWEMVNHASSAGSA